VGLRRLFAIRLSFVMKFPAILFLLGVAFCLRLSADAPLPPPAAGQEPLPVIFKVSEGVRPTSVVSLYGEYLTGTPSVRFMGTDGSVVASQVSVQSDPGGHFCRVIFPAIPAGAYRLSVQNDGGWSNQPIYVNRADPRWLSEERAYPGLQLKLIGRNLDAWEYAGARKTEIRLISTDGKTATRIAPEAVNPYCVDFSIPSDLANGEYNVEVNAHSAACGSDWVRLNDHSEYPDVVHDTVLQIETAPTDSEARELKVAWANDFDWGNVIDVPALAHAVGNGPGDDTVVIQKALNEAVTELGGVVTLPAGVFRIGQLTLPSGVILRGASREGTILMTSKTGDVAFLVKGSRVGISNLTLKYQPDASAPADSLLVGGEAKEVFFHKVTFDLLQDPDVSVNHGPYRLLGDGPMLVAGCRFYISSKNLWDHDVRSGVTFRDNFIDMHAGLGLCMSSEKLLLLHNELVFHPASYAGQMNGFFLNEGWMGWNIYNAYIADNVAHQLKGPGDCQPYCADSAWSCFAGAVTGATANAVDVRLDVSGRKPTPWN
jgi:hypothetical protein